MRHQWIDQQPSTVAKRSVILCVMLSALAMPALGQKAKKKVDAEAVVTLFELVLDSNEESARNCLKILTEKIQTGELGAADVESIKPKLAGLLTPILNGKTDHPLYLDAALLATTWKDPAGISGVQKLLKTAGAPGEQRLAALNALVAADDASLLSAVGPVLADQKSSADFRGQILAALSRMQNPKVAGVVLSQYDAMEPELKPKAIELLTQRPTWARQLLAAIGEKKLPANVLNVNQARRLVATKDKELIDLVQTYWGTVRTERNPQRALVVAQMRKLIRSAEGNPATGEQVFYKLCGQCHKIHGKGQDVGPDITSNGRNSFEQLLSNVFDPSLVIGAAYQARTVATDEGRILTGLLVEDSPQRVVLKMQGGKLETIPRDSIDEMQISKLSMMPEDLEKQLKPQEIIDLFTFITYDKHPSDPQARRLPGASEVVPRETSDTTAFNELISEVAVGFTCKASGERGMAILKEHLGRPGVLRTHPVSPEQPCVLSSEVKLPAGKSARLVVDVSHDKQGDWRLVIKANGQVLHDAIVGKKTCPNGWTEVSVDLSKYAGQDVRLELENRANNWAWEFGYWGRIDVLTQ